MDDKQIIAHIEGGLHEHVARFEPAKAEFTKRFEGNPVDAIEWRAVEMVEAQTRMLLAKQTLEMLALAERSDPEMVKRFYGKAGRPERKVERMLFALEKAQARFAGEVLRGSFYPNSTCPVSNFIAAAKAKATGAFVNGCTDALEGYITQLKSYLQWQAAETE